MTQKINDLRDRMIVALDVPTIWDAYRIVSQLGDAASFYKIGYRLAFAGGLDLSRQLVELKTDVRLGVTWNMLAYENF